MLGETIVVLSRALRDRENNENGETYSHHVLSESCGCKINCLLLTFNFQI